MSVELRQSYEEVLSMDEDILFTYVDVLKERAEQQRQSSRRRR